MEVCLCTLHIMYLTSPAARKSQQKSFRPPSLTFASPCRIVGRPVGCPSIFRSHLQKYALKIAATGELVGLGAYRNMPEGFLVYIEYRESAPHSNPTLSKNRKYRGIGAALLAYGVQLSIDSGYGGTIYLKAKTSEIREHYIRDFGAIPFSHREPFLLLIDGEAARNLLFQFMKEEL